MKTLILFVLFVLSKPIFAQDFLTFNDCLKLAINNNLSLKDAAVSQEIASYQYKASYGRLLPSIFATFDNKNSWGREIDSKTNLYVNKDLKNYIGSVGVTYNLFSGFAAINTIKSAKRESEINKANILAISNQITIELAKKFITILYLEEIIFANQEQINTSAKQLELVTLKFNSGVVPESEMFKIKSQKAAEELNLLTNQNNLTDNLISLKQLMNISLDRQITLVKPILQLHQNVEIKENEFLMAEKAILIQPSYLISNLKEKKAEHELAISRAARYPTLTMRLLYGSNYSAIDPIIPFKEQYNSNLSKGLRFNVLIPIFSQFDNFSKVKTNKLRVQQTRLETQMTKNDISKEVLKAIADTKTSLKKNESSIIGFEYSQKSYEADLLKFELGKISINELNTTKIQMNNSQAAVIQSKYELMYNNALIKFYLGENFTF